MHVLIADKLEQSALDGLKALGCQVTHEPTTGAEGLPAALKRTACDVLIVRSTKVNAAALEASPALRAIVRAGAGVDNIDVPAATARGIRVCNCPGANSIAVAELAMGLLIACDRRIPDQTAALKGGKWNKKEFTTNARGLKGSTLLIVGFGAIGKALAKRAAAFEMDILGWDKFLTPSAISAAGARPVGPDRAQLLEAVAEAGAVSIHIALVLETTKFCDAAFFAAMKPGAIFINTSRGGVVDEAALREAVKSKGLRCGLDVYEGQPGTPQADFVTPTAQLTGCTFTHHCGASTSQAQQAVADETVRILKGYKQSGRLENCVNEQSLPEIKTAAPQPARETAR
jgi:D-3-phosphoglycerate dehydrogenase